MMTHNEPDRDAIVEMLRRLRRRSLFNRLMRDLLTGIGLMLLLWVALQITGSRPSLLNIISGLLVVGLGGRLVWSFARRGSLARTAGITDSLGDLNDEMKTAYSFIREDRSSPWIDHQIHCARDTARQLDPSRIAPVTLPKRLLLADGLILAVVVFLLTFPGLVGELTPESASLSEVERQIRKVADLLQPSEEAGEMTEEPKLEAVRRLDDTIRRLEKGEIALDEGLQEIQETENLLTEANLDMATIQEDLEDIAGDMEGEGALGDVARALKNQKLMEAAELLRALAESASEGESLEDLKELLERLGDAGERPASLEDWLEALEQAAEALQSGDSAEAEQFMENAAEELENIDAQMQLKRRMNQAGVDLEQLRNALARDARFQRVSRKEEGSEAGVQTLDPLDEEVQALAEALASLEVPESEELEGNPDGIPMGPVVGKAQVEQETLPLDVQLEREMLSADEQPEEPVPEEITQKASREEKSELDYEAVLSRSKYLESDVMSAERIPWPYRDIVKRYFQSLQRKTEQ
jgi:exonuclease VII small subunit